MDRVGALELLAVPGIPLIRTGDDLATAIGDALAAMRYAPRPGDVLVVAQKIVSKSEGRTVDLATVTPGAEALRLAATCLKDPRLVQLVLDESSAVVRAAPHVLIVRHRLGHVMANAGIDRSNVRSGALREPVLLLPEDADQSAERLRAALARRLGIAPGVVVSDSFGRPWRQGVVNVALGAAGLASLRDRRGDRDREGRPLAVTQVAWADAIAAAAGLVMGEADEGQPVALVRGLPWRGAAGRALELVRDPREDLFR